MIVKAGAKGKEGITSKSVFTSVVKTNMCMLSRPHRTRISVFADEGKKRQIWHIFMLLNVMQQK